MDPQQSAAEVPRSVLDSLTEEQRKLLNYTIESIKQDLVADAAARLKRQMLTGGVVALIVGLVSFFGLKSTIQSAAVAALCQDAELREAIRDTASSRIDEADEVIEDLKSTAEKLERERTEGNVILNKSIKDLNDLIASLKISHGE